VEFAVEEAVVYIYGKKKLSTLVVMGGFGS